MAMTYGVLVDLGLFSFNYSHILLYIYIYLLYRGGFRRLCGQFLRPPLSRSSPVITGFQSNVAVKSMLDDHCDDRIYRYLAYFDFFR